MHTLSVRAISKRRVRVTLTYLGATTVIVVTLSSLGRLSGSVRPENSPSPTLSVVAGGGPTSDSQGCRTVEREVTGSDPVTGSEETIVVRDQVCPPYIQREPSGDYP